MIDLNQQVKMKWSSPIKKYYESLGYVYTKNNEYFYVILKDVQMRSTVFVDAICDHCNSVYSLPYKDYNKYTNNQTKEYVCAKCQDLERRQRQFSRIVDWALNHNYQLISTLFDYINIDSMICYICPTHGKQYIQARVIFQGSACHLCGNEIQKAKVTYNPEKVKIIARKKDVEIANAEAYVGCGVANLNCTHTICGTEYVSSLDGINKSKYSNCPTCSLNGFTSKIRYSIDEIIAIAQHFGHIIFNLDDYTSVDDHNLIAICGTCGKQFYTSLSILIKNIFDEVGNGCPYCRNVTRIEKTKLRPDYITAYIQKDGNKILNINEYSGIKNENLQIKCSCGSVFITSFYKYQKGRNRCKTCKPFMTQGEFFIDRILTDLNIHHEYQYVFQDCKYIKCLKFDFYLPDINAAIEYDGEQHSMPRFGEDELILTQIRDKIKNDYCAEHNIRLLRIPYTELKNINSIIRDFLLPQK